MKKYKKYIYTVIVVAVIALIVMMSRGTAEPDYELGLVERGDLVQEVSVTGRIVSAEQRDLSFERSGKIAQVRVSVGDIVSAGDALATLDVSELQAQLSQAQATLDAERSVLAEIKQGTRAEEIQIAQTTVENAERSLDAAQTSYASTEQKVSADLLSVYDGTVTALQSAVVNAKNALITLADIQEAHFDNFDQESGRVAQDKAAIVEALLGESSSGYWEAEFISDLDDGLFGEVKALNGEPDTEKIDVNVIRTLDMLSLLRDALNGVPIKAEMTATEKASLTTEKTTISAEITTISSKEQSVAVQRAINESTMKTAEASVTTAQNTLSAARDQLALKQSGNTAESVVTQEARIRAQIASVSLYQTQIAKSTLRTPIDGSVTTQDAKVGVVVSAGAPLVSVMSSGNYEIEAYIPEADITKVDLDDMAIVTLDAYTDDTELTARVIRIDPAETVIEGVPTYKTTLVIDEGAELVKSGMTANIDVVTQIREDVLNIPTRAVVTEDGERFVRNVDALGEVQMLPITTGLRGSDGHIEILEGLEEGQEIITFMSR